MLLAIDSGNTNLVAGIYDGEAAKGNWRADTDPDRTADEYAILFAGWLAEAGLTKAIVTDAIIASVVPRTTGALRDLCAGTFESPPLVIGEADVDLGLKVLMDSPEEVGADRLVNAVAAYVRYGGPLVVVDFGTATTLDVVDADGNYRGGVIAPGVGLSLEALHQAAAKLPRVEVENPGKVIGVDTVSAMQSGIYWGYVSMVEGLVERVTAELQEAGVTVALVIATGGLASLFAGGTKTIERVDPELTLRGLVEIFRRNR